MTTISNPTVAPGRARMALAARRALLDAALDAVVVIDDVGTVLEWNAAAEQVFGYRRDEALGRTMGELVVPPELRRAHGEGMRRYLRTGEARVLGRRIEITAVRKDGQAIPVELAITQVPDVHDVVFVGFLRDITERKRAERAERALSHVGDMFASALDCRERARWTAELVVADMAQACVIALREGRGTWHAERGAGASFDELRQAADEALRTVASTRRDEPDAAIIAVPLVAGCRPLGALAMRVEIASRPVHAADLRLAEDLALRCALAIGHARSYERRSEEAKVLQQCLVPSELAQAPGLVVAGSFHAAGDISRIGGDFYDVFPLRDGRWAAVVGDAGGKGPQAAATATKVRHSLRAICDGFALPSQALARVNDLLLAGEEELCSVALAFVVPGDGGADVVLSLAGHPPPLLQAHDGRVREAGILGPLLGALPDLAWHDERCRVTEGERLVLFTDGLLEQRRGGRRGLQTDELHETLAALAGTSAHHLAERLVAWTVGSQEGDAADDTAVLVLQGAPATTIVERRLDRTPQAVAEARAFLAGVCEGTPDLDPGSLVLMLSELVTNAVRYGSGDATDVLVELSPGAVRVEVRGDGEPFTPPRALPAATATCGRGLMIVDALADRWGVDGGDGRTAVWFALERSRPAPAAARRPAERASLWPDAA